MVAGIFSRNCVVCEDIIPAEKRSDAQYCTKKCGAVARGRKYRERNPERNAQLTKRYRERNPEQHKETWQKYARENPDYQNKYYHLKQYGHLRFMNGEEENVRNPFRKAQSLGYRSGLEVANAEHLKKHGCDFVYEGFAIPYTRPESKHTYCPDYVLRNWIIIETKGIFSVEDRKKHELIQKQHPDLDIRFVFSNSKSKLYKGSPTTYGAWCTKKGFLFADKLIPKEWLTETKGDRACPFSILVAKK